MRRTLLVISFIRLIPHIIFFNFSKNNEIIKYDLKRWISITGETEKYGFVKIMTFYPEFRNLFYRRIGISSNFIKWICPPLNSLFIITKDIGPGLFIQHGFATIIAAKSIGKNCWINQQVTVGFSNATDSPILGDNVVINAGAKIIGKVHIGNNSKAGANAVVVKNVPPNCTVVGVPAYIIKKDGIRVHEKL
ncbi:serine O-acetyltransferase [Leeuwenhoekiella aestuarii]|uniref:serine O-acetyltransferase n=1 Tax=Leeuwenhoekiella aestuarii TaxID=2249426 RepID=UPI000FFF461C|nr:serine acetyltransferase [Leeuwenhoekiella aestuarii]RXG12913.1 serine O-acetyltransferase [Leeuwenhoekiella aestuarii]